MLPMVSHSRRPQSGHITCYLNRTYHVLPTDSHHVIDSQSGRRVLWPCNLHRREADLVVREPKNSNPTTEHVNIMKRKF